MDIRDVPAKLKPNRTGLHTEDAKKRLDIYGRSQIGKVKGPSCVRIFVNQFRKLLVAVLLGVTALSFLVGEFIDATTILVIIAAATVLGFVQESRAE